MDTLLLSGACCPNQVSNETVGRGTGSNRAAPASDASCRLAELPVWNRAHTIETDWATWYGDIVVVGCVDDVRRVSPEDRLRLQAAFEDVVREKDLLLLAAIGDCSLRLAIAAEVNARVGSTLVRDWTLAMSRGDIGAQ
jgi:hypothetical protein